MGSFGSELVSGLLVGSKLGRSLREAELQRELGTAAKVDQETVDSASVSDITKNDGSMVQDSETGRYVPRVFDAQGGMTEAGLAQINGTEGGEASPGVDPTFSTKTSRMYRLGNQEQAEPFSAAQVDAERFRRQADVYSKAGLTDKAAETQGLAKARGEEATLSSIRSAGVAGLKNSKDLREEEKMFASSKNMYEAALKLGRPDLATGYYNQMSQARDVLLDRANDRADRVFHSTGNISGYIDVYNRYIADGKTIDIKKQNEDGSYTFSANDGSGTLREVVVPKDRIGEYVLALRNPKRIAEIEQKRAEILFRAKTEAQEKLNTPMAVGKDQTVVVPATGQTFSPGGQRGFDPKESNQVLDAISKIFVSKYGKADPNDPLAPKGLSDEGLAKDSLAQRLFMENRNLPPSMLAEIADKGTLGQATIEVGGQQQKVPAVSFNGRTYLVGGAQSGMTTPAPAPKPTPAPAAATGTGTRSVSGKIGNSPAGLSRVTPDEFPRVSKAEQSARDVDAGRIRVAESGGVEKAKADLAELDAALANRRLDATQRRILQTERDLLATGISATS